jgi:hypothetical protein
MNYNTHWDYLDVQKVELIYPQAKGVTRLKHASVVGFFIFVIGTIWHFSADSDVAWMAAVIGGVLWVVFSSAYRKNVIKPK